MIAVKFVYGPPLGGLAEWSFSAEDGGVWIHRQTGERVTEENLKVALERIRKAAA